MFFYGYRKKYSRRFGRIPAGWQVHHIDGRRWNNQLANLIALPSTLHRDYHKTKPRNIIWLQRERDVQELDRIARAFSKHLECCKHIAELILLRSKPEKAEQYFKRRM